jgi:hypothetical protein
MDPEILGYVVYVATKITVYASWCYLGVRLFDPARTQSAGIAVIYGFARFLLGFVVGIGIFFAALDMNNATRNAPLTYVAIYVPARIVEWSLWYAVIRRRSASLVRVGGWVGGGVLVSCIADVPLGILEGGVVPIGRPFC